MNFNFSRQQAKWSDVGLIKQVSDSAKYTVTNQEGVACGEFLYNPKWCFFLHGDKRIRFDIKRRWFKVDIVNLVDDKTNEVIGGYYKHWWNSGPWDGFTLYDKYYTFKKLSRFFLFKRSTWNNYKFSLTNPVEEFIYTFKIDYPAISFGSYIERCQFEGTVQSATPDLLPLFAGFFLIEETLRDTSVD